MQKNNVRELGYWAKNWKYPLLFAMRHRISTWGALFVFLLLYALVSTGYFSAKIGQPSLLDSLAKNWCTLENHINIVLQLLTLFVVVAVWFAQLRRDWEASLDMFLSVEFTFNGKIYKQLTAQYSPLFSEADIRLLGQSMGQVRNGDKRLPLDSERNELQKSICIDTRWRICCHPFWHYKITMPLRSPWDKQDGQTSKDKKLQITEFLGNISNGFNFLKKELEKEDTDNLSHVILQIEQLKAAVEREKGEAVTNGTD